MLPTGDPEPLLPVQKPVHPAHRLQFRRVGLQKDPVQLLDRGTCDQTIARIKPVTLQLFLLLIVVALGQ
jgi:hypothetical protein